MTIDTVDSVRCENAARPAHDVARTWLLTPGRPDGNADFARAERSAADVVVLDLEDGLPDALKPEGRRAVRDWLGSHHAWVRVSPAATAEWSADLLALADAPGLRGVMLAKAETVTDVAATAGRLGAGIPIVALIESAIGLESALEIARHPACVRLAFGLGDFRRDTGIADDPVALAYPRTRLTVASRAARLPGPIDGPTLRGAETRLRDDTETTQSTGMTGRLCLDPAHAGVINSLMSPSADEIADARATVHRLGGGGSVYDGSDLPALGRAQALLQRAERLGLSAGA
ncbi:aldolase/citrate lyase family protein [Gordonia sp. CPCC 205515]|uniref:HpcH/HpaI aldolase/citrate lyase family protein n=1 Tax=Gordonia sp. CPCC 205515 TaxID=3140791 RepID=UPI003AF3AA82